MVKIEGIPFKTNKEKFKLNKFLSEQKRKRKIKHFETLEGCIYVEHYIRNEVIGT